MDATSQVDARINISWIVVSARGRGILLTHLSLEPMRTVTKLNRKLLKNRKSQESFTVPVSVSYVNTFLGHMSNPDLGDCSNISTTSFSPSNSTDTTIQLHAVRCCELTSLVQCNTSRSRCCPRIHRPEVVSSSSRRDSRSYPPSS